MFIGKDIRSWMVHEGQRQLAPVESLEQSKGRTSIHVDVQVLARANRERLRVLLSEAEKGSLGDNDRYAAALRCSL